MLCLGLWTLAIKVSHIHVFPTNVREHRIPGKTVRWQSCTVITSLRMFILPLSTTHGLEAIVFNRMFQNVSLFGLYFHFPTSSTAIYSN